MSLHIPAETYETLFRDSPPIPGVFSWTNEGGCDYCDVIYKNKCNKLIPELLAKHDLSPTQALLCVNDKVTVIQLEDYPEYFV